MNKTITYKVGNKIFDTEQEAEKYLGIELEKIEAQKIKDRIGYFLVFSNPAEGKFAGYLRKDVFPIDDFERKTLLDKYKTLAATSSLIEDALSFHFPIYTPIHGTLKMARTFFVNFTSSPPAETPEIPEVYLHEPFSLEKLSYNIDESRLIVKELLAPLLK